MTDANTTLVPYESQLLSKARAIGVDLTPMLEQVPEADDDAYVGIIRSIIEAKDVAGLDAPWTAKSLQEYVDKPIRVDAIRKMPSDFDEGLGLYLVLDCTISNDGEKATLTTGSVNIVVQLVRAFTLNALPLVCIPRLSKKPSRNGYRPMHLEMMQ